MGAGRSGCTIELREESKKVDTMRKLAIIPALFFLVLCWQPGGGKGKANTWFPTKPDAAQTDSRPFIKKVRLHKKNIIVEGENFQRGATIYLYRRRETRNDEQSPNQILIAPKLGKKLTPGSVHSFAVINNDEQWSIPPSRYLYFEGYLARVVDLQEANPAYSPPPVSLKLGEVFVTNNFSSSNYAYQIPDSFLNVGEISSSNYILYQPQSVGVFNLQFRDLSYSEAGPRDLRFTVYVE